MGFTTPSLKGRALRLLGQREHSRLELQRKLAPHVQEGEDLVAVLDELEAKGFISEQRVVDSVLHQRARRLGSARIRQELQAKGIAPEAMAQALDGLRDTELARAAEVWRQRFGGSNPATDQREHARQVRFLMARGFSAETVRRVVRGRGPDDE